MKTAYAGGAEVMGSLAVKSASDVIFSGATVTIPAGLYDLPINKSVASGTATPSLTITSNLLSTALSSYPVEVTPKTTVGAAGYISSIADGAKETKNVQVESKTATPSTNLQTITTSSGKLPSAAALSGSALTAEF